MAPAKRSLSDFVSPERQKRLLVLSNNHILANCNDCQAGDAIHQPGPLDMLPNITPSPTNQIGVLEHFCRGAIERFDLGDQFIARQAVHDAPSRRQVRRAAPRDESPSRLEFGFRQQTARDLVGENRSHAVPEEDERQVEMWPHHLD